jgi:hypothetical protein
MNYLALRSWLLLVLISACGAAVAAPLGSVPFVLDGNRVYAEVEFIASKGEPRRALVFVDLGSPSMVLSNELYEELNLGTNKVLGFRVGATEIPVESRLVNSDVWFPFSIGKNRKVEGLLPAGVLQKYQVIFDYAAHGMTLAESGTLTPRGTPVPFRLNAITGLIAIEATIDGQNYPITIDNGSGFTWIRKPAAQEWLARHPDWKRGTGAVGPSNMRMAEDGIETGGTLVRIPEITLGSLRVRQVSALAIGPDDQGHDFMDWYSTKNALPVIGWLGGNVLRHFRITIDYPQQMSYWEPQSALDVRDFDYVGLTLAWRHGEYYVAGIATLDARPTAREVQVGDKLVQIGKLQTRGASREAVFAAMHGRAGEIRTLILERAGVRLTVPSRVTAF